MNLQNIKNMAGPRVGLATLVLKKNSPEIMVVSGIGGGVVAAIMLAKAHKNADERIHPIFDQIDELREAVKENNELYTIIEESPEIEHPENSHYYTKMDAAKAVLPLYLELGKEALMLYGPALLLGGVSIMLIVGGHGILRKRNQALMSSFVLIERAFNVYRERVRSELGQEGDERFLYGLESRTETVMTVDKDGKKVKTKTQKNATPEELSPMMYQRRFDRTNINWQEAEQSNFFWLGVAQQMMQDKLDGQGFVFLNDVYKLLGFDATPEGQIVGWSLAAPGDNFITFGIDKAWNEGRADGSILLDFNVNGPVYRYVGLKSPLSKDFSSD